MSQQSMKSFFEQKPPKPGGPSPQPRAPPGKPPPPRKRPHPPTSSPPPSQSPKSLPAPGTTSKQEDGAPENSTNTTVMSGSRASPHEDSKPGMYSRSGESDVVETASQMVEVKSGFSLDVEEEGSQTRIESGEDNNNVDDFDEVPADESGVNPFTVPDNPFTVPSNDEMQANSNAVLAAQLLSRILAANAQHHETHKDGDNPRTGAIDISDLIIPPQVQALAKKTGPVEVAPTTQQTSETKSDKDQVQKLRTQFEKEVGEIKARHDAELRECVRAKYQLAQIRTELDDAECMYSKLQEDYNSALDEIQRTKNQLADGRRSQMVTEEQLKRVTTQLTAEKVTSATLSQTVNGLVAQLAKHKISVKVQLPDLDPELARTGPKVVVEANKAPKGKKPKQASETKKQKQRSGEPDNGFPRSAVASTPASRELGVHAKRFPYAAGGRMDPNGVNSARIDLKICDFDLLCSVLKVKRIALYSLPVPLLYRETLPESLFQLLQRSRAAAHSNAHTGTIVYRLRQHNMRGADCPFTKREIDAINRYDVILVHLRHKSRLRRRRLAAHRFEKERKGHRYSSSLPFSVYYDKRNRTFNLPGRQGRVALAYREHQLLYHPVPEDLKKSDDQDSKSIMPSENVQPTPSSK